MAHSCINCGSDDRIFTSQVVACEYGGESPPANVLALCRTCRLLSFYNTQASGAVSDSRMTSFWVSADLNAQIRACLETSPGGIQSLASLTRYLADIYTESPDNFDDVGLYQDQGMDVKLNFLIPLRMRETLKTSAAARNITVADLLRGLYMIFLGCLRTAARKEVSP